MTTDPPATPPPTPPSQRMPEGEFPTGPAIGERFPDATLLNQRGEPVSLEAARAGRRGLIVFQRSARW